MIGDDFVGLLYFLIEGDLIFEYIVHLHQFPVDVLVLFQDPRQLQLQPELNHGYVFMVGAIDYCTTFLMLVTAVKSLYSRIY